MKQKDIGKAFKNAKGLLFDGHSGGENTFMCHAIRDGSTDWMWPTDAVMRAISIIEHRLHPHTTVETWVGVNIPGADKDARNIPRKEIQAFRHRWLDSLIKEFS